MKKYLSGLISLRLEQGAEGLFAMLQTVTCLIEKHCPEISKRCGKRSVDAGPGAYKSASDGLSLSAMADDDTSHLSDKYLDGMHTLTDYNKLAAYGLQRVCIEGTRDRAMLLLAHAALLRGRDARQLELSECHISTVHDEGQSECNPMTVLLPGTMRRANEAT